MKRKRLIVVLILMLLIVSWGCGKSDKREVGEVNLVFWHSFVASSRQALTTLLNEFETANPGIHIQAQYVPTGDALMQKLITAIQSKTAPDIAWIHPDFIDKLANNRSIYALRQFIDGPDGLPASDLADIYLPLIEAATWHDSLYALPMEATTLALICNRDLFKKAGLNPDTPPRTWEELKVYARQLTQDMDQDGKIDRYGFYVPVFPAGGPLNLWMIMQWAPFVWQAGGNLIDPESRMASFDQMAGVKALELWNELYHLQKFAQFSLSHDLGFMSQTVAMIMDGPWNLPRYRTIENFEWMVAELPSGPEAQITYMGGEHLVIFKQSVNPDQAWKFVKWVIDPGVQARFSINSGYLPVRRATLNIPSYSAHLQNDQALQVFVREMNSARTREMPDSHRAEFNRLIARAIEETIIGGKNPVNTLRSAARDFDITIRNHK